jgi:hypothetical protein
MLKIMLLIVLVVCIGPFFIKTTDGYPVISVADVSSGVGVNEVLERFMHAPSVASITGLIDGVIDPEGAADGEKNTAKVNAGSVTQVYKWRDELGIWQFSDGPNVAEGSALIEISNQINLMPALDSTGYEAAQPAGGSSPSVMDSVAKRVTKSAAGFDLSKRPAGLTASDVTAPDLTVGPELLVQMGQAIEAYQQAIDDQDKALEQVMPRQH